MECSMCVVDTNSNAQLRRGGLHVDVACAESQLHGQHNEL